MLTHGAIATLLSHRGDYDTPFLVHISYSVGLAFIRQTGLEEKPTSA